MTTTLQGQGTLVRDLPERERPVNRLREAGPMALSTVELLACLLQTGHALEQARELLVAADSAAEHLADAHDAGIERPLVEDLLLHHPVAGVQV